MWTASGCERALTVAMARCWHRLDWATWLLVTAVKHMTPEPAPAAHEGAMHVLATADVTRTAGFPLSPVSAPDVPVASSREAASSRTCFIAPEPDLASQVSTAGEYRR